MSNDQWDRMTERTVSEHRENIHRLTTGTEWRFSLSHNQGEWGWVLRNVGDGSLGASAQSQ